MHYTQEASKIIDWLIKHKSPLMITGGPASGKYNCIKEFLDEKNIPYFGVVLTKNVRDFYQELYQHQNENLLIDVDESGDTVAIAEMITTLKAIFEREAFYKSISTQIDLKLTGSIIVTINDKSRLFSANQIDSVMARYFCLEQNDIVNATV